MHKRTRLEKLNAHMLACSRCALRCGASQVVPGDGNPEAQILFIGEAPGKKEDESGLPFVGSTGKILDKMLESIKIKREDVYLTNICKCRPPENRDPSPEEIKECRPWLEKQIEIIDPKIIITLGRHALNCFLPEAKISEVHGQVLDVDIKKIGKIEGIKPSDVITRSEMQNSYAFHSLRSTIKLFPLHHPAAARINKITRALFAEDFEKIPKLLKNKKEH